MRHVDDSFSYVTPSLTDAAGSIGQAWSIGTNGKISLQHGMGISDTYGEEKRKNKTFKIDKFIEKCHAEFEFRVSNVDCKGKTQIKASGT